MERKERKADWSGGAVFFFLSSLLSSFFSSKGGASSAYRKSVATGWMVTLVSLVATSRPGSSTRSLDRVPVI